MQSEQTFLQAIREGPDARQTCLVFADWLEEQGDPHGVFMHLQCAAERLPSWSPRRFALEAEAQALALQHEAEWLGPLLGVASHWEFRHGLLHWVTVDAPTFLAHAAEWLPALPLLGVHLRKTQGHVAALAACPQLAHLNALYLGDNKLTDDDLAVLCASPHVRNLKELYLHSNRLDVGGVRALASSPHLARLRELSLGNNDLRGPGMQTLAGAEGLEELRHLNLIMTFPEAEDIQALAGSALLGRLRTLFLSSNVLPAGCLRILTESPAFAGVRRLAYEMNDSTDADVQALAASPHVRNLTHLALTRNRELGDASLAALADSPNLSRLRSLSLGPARYGRGGLRALGRSRTLTALRSLHLTAEKKMTETAHHLLRGRLVRRLRELSLAHGSIGPKGLDALAAHPAPLRLRQCDLTLARDDAPHWEALLAKGSLSRVTDLTVHGLPAGTLASLHAPGRLPYLYRLALSGLSGDAVEVEGFLDSPLLRRLHDLSLFGPKTKQEEEIVRRLALASGESPLQRLGLGWSLSPQQVQLLTAGGTWPRLSHLLIGSFRLGAEGMGVLAAWPLLRQLRVLTLENSSFKMVPGVEALADSRVVGPLLRIEIHNGGVEREVRPLLRQRLGGRFAPSGRREPRVITVGNLAMLAGGDED